MYLIGLLVFMVLTILFSGFSAGAVGNLVDPQSLLVILLVTIPVVLLAGSGKDFVNAFKLTVTKQKEVDIAELKKASAAISLVMKTILYSGVFGSLLGCIALLRQMDDPAALGPHIMGALIALLYAMIFNIMLLPIKAKVDKMIIEYLHE